MPLLSVPPWKTKTTKGTIVYSKEVPEGHFLEVLSLIASRLVDLNETLKDIERTLEISNTINDSQG